MTATFEILILVTCAVLSLMVSDSGAGTGGLLSKDFKRGSKIDEKKYVQYIASKPILSMTSANIEFDGDVFFASDENMWDWNESPQETARRPSLYLADPFINIEHAPGEFQPML